MKKNNIITLEIAKNWTDNWRKLESNYNKHHKCRAFNIPKKDLQEVLAEDGVESIRAYLGVKETVNSTTKKIIYEEKLIIVGVNKNNKDMISTVKSSNIGNPGDDIYDLTTPCPDLCDTESPLNG